jgi:hypothetical protein
MSYKGINGRGINFSFKGLLTAAALSILTVVCGLVAVTLIRAQERQVVRQTTVRNESQSPSSSSEIESSWTSDDEQVRVKARNLELTDDGQAIKSLHDGGYLSISEKRGGKSRELKVTQGLNGNLEYAFSVQGRAREFDADAQQWLSKSLLAFVRNSGFAAGHRVNLILRQQGPDGLLAETSLIPSDNIKRLYLQKLVEQGNLDAATLVRVIEKAGQEITSSYELTEFLISIKDESRQSSEVRAAFMKTLERLPSDYDRGRVLAAIAKTE